jgi:glycosyltransferase involved in cell wall biosynthesis
MISYLFPPITDVGGLRALGFAKHLPEYGWVPHVLSVKNPDRSLCHLGPGGPPEGIDTTYCRSLFHLNRISWKANGVLRLLLGAFGITFKGNIVHELFCLPDVFAGWVLPAYLAGRRIMKRRNIDIIYVSSKPFSSTLVGVLLKKATGKPLVLDFRDPASFPETLFLGNQAGRIRQRLIGKIERYVLKNADYLLTTTRATEAAYLQRYPFLKGRTLTIYNGYYLPGDSSEAADPFDVFTIVYLGNFYYDLLPSDTFFKALRAVVDRGLIPVERIRFLYVGGLREKSNWLETAARHFGIEHLVETTGHVPRETAQTLLTRSALMLLRIVPPMISTKLFEGLRDGVPMLAIIDKGEVETLLRRYSPGSFVVTSRSVDDVVGAIAEAYRRWRTGTLAPRPSVDYNAHFNKKALTALFSQVLEAVLEPNPPS